MKIFSAKKDLQDHLDALRQQGETIGLVPTMGALHEGHLSLLSASQAVSSTTVCTIFVNPTQFTNAEDLTRYPRPIDQDIRQLEAAGCSVLFNPPVNEMYAGDEQWHIDLGTLESVLEGEFRPGHYQGVTQIVYKLFELIKPDTAFFGQKDYQQFLVIEKMVQLFKLPVKLVMCPIKREPDGLAMSSRNVHLSAEEHRHALVLSAALNYVTENYNETGKSAVEAGRKMINEEAGVDLEYLEVADGKTLQAITTSSESVVVLTAAKVGATRLIDNMIIR